jgi:YHS domain-containing protein
MAILGATYMLAVTGGIVHYFCSKGCKAAFDKDPEKFGSAKKS